MRTLFVYSSTLIVFGAAIVSSVAFAYTVLAQLLVITIVSGSLYAIAASGLTLTYGIQRVMNVAHGDIIVLGSYVFLSFSLYAQKVVKVDPAVFIIAVLILLALFGAFINKVLIDPVRKYGFEPPILVTFGVLIFLEAALQLYYGADVQGITTAYSSITYVVQNVFVQYLGLVTFISCLFVFGVMEFVISRTDLGRAIRASSQDPDAAELSGIDVKRIQTISFVIGTMLAGVAGILFGLTQGFTPTTGPNILIIVLTIIVLGGIGNLSGTYLSSMIISIVTVLLSYYFNAGIGYLASLVIFLVIIVIRPSGLLGRSGR